ncbi:hypothetical protein VTG60DRAFT_673 [Thermothelomyces hinnuleus]
MLPKIFYALLAAAPHTRALSITPRADALVECLQSSLSPQGVIILPDEGELFVNATVRQSFTNEPTFRVVAQAYNEQDVRGSINCAARTNTSFLVTGPRHGFYKGFDRIQDGLEISTAAFNSISVDLQANTMTVGGAVHMQDVVEALYAVGKQIPVGSGACVGLLGASLGAGLGRLQGLYGFISDNLLSARLMLPNTTVVEVSSNSYPELFWGIRGAGSNFGVVLNATYVIHDQAPNGEHFVADFQYPLNATRAFWQAIKDHASDMPAPLCVDTAVLWDDNLNETSLYVNAVYAGPESEGRKAIEFLSNIGTSLRQNLSEVPWNKLTQTAFFSQFGLGDAAIECKFSPGYRKPMDVAFNRVDVDAHVRTMNLFNELLTKYPFMRGSDMTMQFCAPQGTSAFPDDYTAYPWRRVLGQQTFGFDYPNGTVTDSDIEHYPQRIRAALAKTSGMDGPDGLAAYINFSNGDEPIESIYSKKHLPRLAALKKKYDPHGLFNAYHPLPTSYPH